MAWIESHQELAAHPKTRKLAKLLDINVPQTIGHLQCLWWWALDYAQDGDIGKYDAEDIAIACMWDGDPDTLLTALRAARFVDDGRALHDWNQYGGKLVRARERNAQRARNARGGSREQDEDAPDTDTVRAPHVGDTRTERAEKEERREEESTGENSTGENQREAARPPCADEPRPLSPVPETEAAEEVLRKPKRRSITEDVIRDFEEEFPRIDVRRAADDYLNWAGSARHVDKVLGLRNQLLDPVCARKFPSPVDARSKFVSGPLAKFVKTGTEAS